MKTCYIFSFLLMSILLSCGDKTSEKEVSAEINTQTVIDSTDLKRENTIPRNQSAFMHSVYFWLKNPDKQEDHELFLSSMRTFLDQSPNLISYHIGKPAGTDREVVDNTYDYSLIVSFKDSDSHERYQIEEAHQKLRDETAGLWSKLLIYDSESQLVSVD